MFRPASRALLRAPAPSAAFRPAPRRLLSTSAEGKSRSWKNTAVRLGLAIGAVYYYNTSSVFAEHSLFSRKQSPQSTDASPAPTLDSVKPRIRDERAQSQPAGQHADAQQPQPQTEPQPSDPGAVNPADLEEEAGQEAAFNPETGEINWDCPCLGGMAHGPCGEEFKAAFSCFVYSQEEPKGMDCIDKFKGMQDCFRAHPEVYGSELDDEDDGAAPAADTGAGAPSAESPNSDDQAPATQLDAAAYPGDKQSRAKEVKSQMNESTGAHPEQAESDQLLPKAWHDTEQKNTETKAARAEK